MADELDVKAAGDLGRIEGKLDQALIDHGHRIKSLESWRDWAVRLVMGAVMLAVLGVVIGAKTGAL